VYSAEVEHLRVAAQEKPQEKKKEKIRFPVVTSGESGLTALDPGVAAGDPEVSGVA
jgi:hypothetical protein